MATHIYAEPVARLLSYGEVEISRPRERWPDYLEVGLTDEHVSDLIRMAMDAELNASGGDGTEVWAPLHAWRALGQLRAEQAAPSLVRLFELPDDDWVADDLPRVFAMIGPAAIPALAAYLDDANIEERCRISIPDCLEQIARRHPAARDDCIAVLMGQFEKFRTNGSGLNGFLISALIDLRATQIIDVIRKAFIEDRVDERVAGDVEEVEIEMGLRKYRSTPRPRLNFFGRPFDPEDRYAGNGPVRHGAKVGRNEPCPCGSGKKFKKCCLH